VTNYADITEIPLVFERQSYSHTIIFQTDHLTRLWTEHWPGVDK